MKISKDKVELEMARQGLKLADLAKKLKLTPKRIYQITAAINSSRDLTPYAVHQLAKSLNVPVEEILVDAFSQPQPEPATKVTE